MFVKICGMTRVEDAVAAAECGADAIGFIFWPDSPRCVEPLRAREIAAAVQKRVATVGVFVDQSADEIARIADLVQLSSIQLHGGETPEFAAALGWPVIKAVTLGDPLIERWPASVTVLLDAHDPVKKGGTGTAIDWNLAAAVARRRPVVLAGGLTPENVGEAITHVRPFGIDVSSGVEQAPGVKHPERIRALFKAIHATHNVPA